MPNIQCKDTTITYCNHESIYIFTDLCKCFRTIIVYNQLRYCTCLYTIRKYLWHNGSHLSHVCPQAAAGAARAQPADMQRALLGLLQGKQVSAAPAAGGDHHPPVPAAQQWVPPLVAAGAPVVLRSTQLLQFYGLLAQSEAACTQALVARRRQQLGAASLGRHRVQVCCRAP